MRAIGLRKAAALVVAVSLLFAAAPAAAAPDRAPGEPEIGSSMFQAFTAWLAALWPSSGPAATPSPAWAALGAAPSVGAQLGPDLDLSGEPTVQPQLGPDADPDG
jgi:hypothetical protein